jgi:hypothetical protein
MEITRPAAPQQKTVIIVAPEFPPCNLTAGHRTRLFVRNLPEFGYHPIVLTIRPEYYETGPDPELLHLVAPGVEIIRTRALPTRPIRFVGDLGIRSLPFHLAAIRKLVRARRVDLVYIPMPPNYSSLLGPVINRLWGIPYAVDYIDPWLYSITPQEKRWWKARLSHMLACQLEPVALSRTGGITGVAEGYYAGVLDRHPRLRRYPSAGIPYGGEPFDHEYVRTIGGRPRLLDRPEFRDRIVVTYAGAVLPRAHGTLRALLRACKQWIASGAPVAARVMLLFVGTGSRPNDPRSGQVRPIAKQYGALGFVQEIADRQPYLEVLRLLHHSHAVMILGSSEASYTASKTFQALYSLRPVLGLLHRESSASAILGGMAGVALVNFDDRIPVEHCEAEIQAALRQVAAASADPVPRSLGALNQYSAREMTRRLAKFFDAVLAGQDRRSPAS